MIANEQQYETAKRKERSFCQAIEQFDAEGVERKDVDPRIRQAEREGMVSQRDDLRAEMDEYDRLKAAGRPVA